jgi:hypothetical protein
MAPSDSPRLATFARLIARGYPRALAAKRAGYWDLRASRAATRLAPRPAAAAPKAPRAAAPPAKATKAPVKVQAQATPPARPPPPPMLTEEEWVAKYNPTALSPSATRA